MKTLTATLILGAAWLAPASLFATAYTEGIVTIPGAIEPPQAYAIDANDQIVGSLYNASGSHGFVLSTGVVAQVDQPGGLGTSLLGINNLTGMVGYETTAAGFSAITDGGRRYRAIQGGVNKVLTGINASGELVGYDYVGRSFVFANGVYTYVVPTPCATLSQPRIYINGVNSAGDFVGWCNDTHNGTTRGFARIGGVDQEISTGNTTFPTGINDSDDISGYDTTGTTSHGFIFSGGTFQVFNFTGSQYTSTQVLGINNKGSLVGQTFDSNQSKWVGFYALTN